MITLLTYPAMVEHDDAIGIDNGGKPVGDHQRRLVIRDPSQGTENIFFGLAVETGSCLVEHQDGGVFE